ncbi:acyltransferase [Acidovorax sp.]|uniref:acyltransferase family protein n=1 Tax=Acidovorax sp. TaxID=1872122 RepID=UPI0031E2B727
MLGSLRFFLALFVVIGHLTEGVHFFSHWGVFAVFGFYVISGYLITLILNEIYSFRLSAFVFNRFLRLFPIYYVVATATLIALTLSSGANTFHAAWTIQTRWMDIFGNFLIIPFEFYDSSFRLVPPTWSVAVELVNYLILWLIVARSRTLTFLIFSIVCLYHISSLFGGADWGRRYSPYYAALLPFSAGSLLYFFKDSVDAIHPQWRTYISKISFASWLINLILCGFIGGLGGKFFNWFFYVNLLSLTAFLYLNLPSSESTPTRWWDKKLGDLAYPIFLTHWIVGYAVSQLLLDGQRRGIILFATSVIPIIAISYALSKIADSMIEPLRAQVRNKVKR